jgi:hypothetical protein
MRFVALDWLLKVARLQSEQGLNQASQPQRLPHRLSRVSLSDKEWV